MIELQEERRAAVEKVLHSQVFRSSESLRRLLAFLSEKTLAGKGDQLKEYSVGIDAFGKPPDYDPRHDSAVRIQVGRLRQKLSEYYRTEGKDDTVVVDLPKGGFRLNFEVRAKHEGTEIVATHVQRMEEPSRNHWLLATLAGALAVTLAWAIWATAAWNRESHLAATEHAAWNPALETLWAPFIQSDRPIVLAIGSPLFIGIQGVAYYRDLTVNTWEKALADSKLKDLRRVLGNPEIFPHRSYTGTGDAQALFLLGKFLGTRKDSLVFAKTADLSWQQVSANNVILLGTPRSYGELLNGLPAQLEIRPDDNGIRVLHPAKGEPELFTDATLRGQRPAAAPEDGQVYALITRVPGPNGNGVVAAFSSNLNSGTAAAVQWFSEPQLAYEVSSLLKDSSGAIPRYFQVLLRVRFKGGVPTETNYVLHRVLRADAPVTGR